MIELLERPFQHLPVRTWIRQGRSLAQRDPFAFPEVGIRGRSAAKCFQSDAITRDRVPDGTEVVDFCAGKVARDFLWIVA